MHVVCRYGRGRGVSVDSSGGENRVGCRVKGREIGKGSKLLDRVEGFRGTRIVSWFCFFGDPVKRIFFVALSGSGIFSGVWVWTLID